MISVVRGKLALVAKIILLALISAIFLMLAQSAFAQKEYVIGIFLFAVILLTLFTYLTKKSIPLKFFLPTTYEISKVWELAQSQYSHACLATDTELSQVVI